MPASASRRTRLIPAWAGKTFMFDSPCPCFPAHPRVGGENNLRHILGFWFMGSSPRGRGKHRAGMPMTMTRRLIPAWAGKTPNEYL